MYVGVAVSLKTKDMRSLPGFALREKKLTLFQQKVSMPLPQNKMSFVFDISGRCL
jgi:hypothetical protein